MSWPLLLTFPDKYSLWNSHGGEWAASTDWLIIFHSNNHKMFIYKRKTPFLYCTVVQYKKQINSCNDTLYVVILQYVACGAEQRDFKPFQGCSTLQMCLSHLMYNFGLLKIACCFAVNLPTGMLNTINSLIRYLDLAVLPAILAAGSNYLVRKSSNQE